VIESAGRIDILKVDTEGLEVATIMAIGPEMLGSIGAIYYEAGPEGALSLPGFHHRYRCETHHLIRM
jgi:hypothetical protein